MLWGWTKSITRLQLLIMGIHSLVDDRILTALLPIFVGTLGHLDVWRHHPLTLCIGFLFLLFLAVKWICAASSPRILIRSYDS